MTGAVVVLSAGLSCPHHGTGVLVPQPAGSTPSTHCHPSSPPGQDAPHSPLDDAVVELEVARH